MSTPLSSISIVNWSAWAPEHLTTKTAWQAWSHAPVIPAGEAAIDAIAIPPMIRRRCNKLSKISIQTASEALAKETVDYVVFCSQHGDLQCTVSLLNDIAQQHMLSPTQFTQSVHNTAAGLFSIIGQLQQNMTFISAGDNTFFMGMLEALSWLTAHNDNKVLLIMADAYLPEVYQTLNIDDNHEYALALLLSGDAVGAAQFSIMLDKAHTAKDQTLPQALQWLAWYLQATEQHFVLAAPAQALHWTRL